MAGLRCPHCRAVRSKVTNTRPVHGWRWRRHRCAECDQSYSTVEVLYTERLRERFMAKLQERVSTCST